MSNSRFMDMAHVYCALFREQVFDMVRQTHFRGFNFSSVFFDDRDGFDEPHLQVLIEKRKVQRIGKNEISYKKNGMPLG